MGERALRRWEIEDSGIPKHWTEFLEFSGREGGGDHKTKEVKGKMEKTSETADPS